jgi:signal transduction histidine kinase
MAVEKKTKDLQELNESLAIKIKEEVEKNLHIQEKLFKSEKMASMGEMLGNIAHQWRQPLSIISTGATGMQIQKEYGLLTDDFFEETCNDINKNTQYLSKTIDDFKNFILGDRKKIVFNLSEDINSFISLVKGAITSNNIKLILDIEEDVNLYGYPNELIQCFMNIFNNSKDALVENNIQHKFIFISTSLENNNAIIKIKDNAGGIPSDVLSHVFEPYFTTKHKSKGTGIGLHMTYNLIVNGMEGSIEASNFNYEYEGELFTGAELIISLPLS